MTFLWFFYSVDEGAILDCIFEEFQHPSPAGFERIMIEKALLWSSSLLQCKHITCDRISEPSDCTSTYVLNCPSAMWYVGWYVLQCLKCINTKFISFMKARLTSKCIYNLFLPWLKLLYVDAFLSFKMMVVGWWLKLSYIWDILWWSWHKGCVTVFYDMLHLSDKVYACRVLSFTTQSHVRC